VDCELLERLVSRFSPTFKDRNNKASIYVIIEIRVSQRDRWIALGFELPIPGNGQKKGLVDGSKPCSSSPQAYG
jgi:hypothetical protein